MGAAGLVIVFVFGLAGLAIAGGIVIPYIGHCFMTVYRETAAGNDDVVWQGDTVIDWVRTTFHLLAILAGPVLLVRGVQIIFFPTNDPAFDLIAAIFLATWLLFPICLMSSMVGMHPWILLHPVVLGRLVRNPLALLVFYILSGGLLIAATYLIVKAITGDTFTFFTAAVFGAMIPLLYGRLLGRLAWVVGYHTNVTSRQKKRRKRLKGAVVEDPWAIPKEEDAVPEVDIEVLDDDMKFVAVEQKSEGVIDLSQRTVGFTRSISPSRPGSEADEEDEWTPRKKPYEVMSDTEAEASWRDRSDVSTIDPENVIAVADEDLPDDEEEDTHVTVLSQGTARDSTRTDTDVWKPEAAKLRPKKRRKPSVFESMISGVVTFPLHRGAARAWFNLVLAGLCFGLVLRVLVMTWPL